MGQQRHFDRVRGLVSGQSGVPEAEITLETRLFEDLGMDGGDGQEFLSAFGHEFGVDISGVAPVNYFNEEASFAGYSLMIPVIAFVNPVFRARAMHASRRLRSLSVRDLVASARAGRWITPQVPRRDADLTRLSRRGRLVLAGSFLIPALLGVRAYAGGISAFHALEITLWALLAVWAVLGVKFLLALSWLKRLDAAASFEEQALNSGFSAKD